MDQSQSEPPEVVVTALCEVLDYLYDDERAHFLGSDPADQRGHIFASLVIIRAWLHGTGRVGPRKA